jgi:choline dehydrogenase-like flavoprotein
MTTVRSYSPHHRYANATEDWPDIQLFLASYADNTDGGLLGKRDIGLTDDYYDAVYKSLLYMESYSVISLLLRPGSRGRIRLKNANPHEYPLIYPNYFHHPADIAVIVSMDVYEIRGSGGGHCGGARLPGRDAVQSGAHTLVLHANLLPPPSGHKVTDRGFPWFSSDQQDNEIVKIVPVTFFHSNQER